MTNSAFSAAERRHLQEPDPQLCDWCDRDAEPGSALCAGCADDQHDYDQDAAQAREERAEARGRHSL